MGIPTMRCGGNLLGITNTRSSDDLLGPYYDAGFYLPSIYVVYIINDWTNEYQHTLRSWLSGF